MKLFLASHVLMHQAGKSENRIKSTFTARAIVTIYRLERSSLTKSTDPMNTMSPACGAAVVHIEPPTGVSAQAGTAAPNQEALLKAAILLLEGLSRNVMSGDVWLLSSMHAARRAADAGMTELELGEALERLMEKIDINRKSNPISSMF